MPWTGGNGPEATGRESGTHPDNVWARRQHQTNLNFCHSRSKEFDTLGTWDTRLNVAIDEAAMLKTGQVDTVKNLNALNLTLYTTGGAKH